MIYGILTPTGQQETCKPNPLKTKFYTGDFITAAVKSFPVIFHRGIVVANGDCIWVYHNTPSLINEAGGSVIKESLADFLKSRTIINIKHTPLTRQHIETIAESKANEKFNILKFNCEQFAFNIKDGRPRSPQLAVWSIVLFLLGKNILFG